VDTIGARRAFSFLRRIVRILMRLSDIKFSNLRLAFQKGAGKKLNTLIGIIGKGLVTNVSGNVQSRRTDDGWELYFPHASRLPTVAGVGSGETRTDVSGGTVMPVDAVKFNFDSIDSSGSIFLAIDSGALKFTKPGTYLVTYSAGIEAEVRQAIAIKPGVGAEGEFFLRAGEQKMLGTSGFVTACEIPNLTGLIRLNEGETELILDTDLTGAHVTSETLTALPVFKDPSSAPTMTVVTELTVDAGFGACGELEGGQVVCRSGVEGGTNGDTFDPDLPPENLGNAIDFDALETAGVISSTITQDATDITTANATPLTDDDTNPDGVGITVKGTASGSAIVTVVREETTMEMKIDVGGTLYAPKIDVFGQRNAGRGNVYGVNLTLSVLKL